MMEQELTPREVRKEARRIIKNLSRRVARIEKLGNAVPQDAVLQYRELEPTIPKRIDKISDRQARELLKDLQYIDRLKSSSVKGAKQAQQKWIPIKEKLDALSKEQQEKFWKGYGKLYSRTALMENFKYEIFATNIDYIYGVQDEDRIVQEVIDIYDQLQETRGVTDAEIQFFTARKISELRDQFNRGIG